MNKETLLERCQREAGKEALRWLEGRVEENYAYIGDIDDLTSVYIDGWFNVDELLKLIIANTLKQAAEAMEVLKRDQNKKKESDPHFTGCGGCGEDYPAICGCREVNQVLIDAQKVLGVDLSE